MPSEVRVNIKLSKTDVTLAEWTANVKPKLQNLALQLRNALFTVDFEGGFFEREAVE